VNILILRSNDTLNFRKCLLNRQPPGGIIRTIADYFLMPSATAAYLSFLGCLGFRSNCGLERRMMILGCHLPDDVKNRRLFGPENTTKRQLAFFTLPSTFQCKIPLLTAYEGIIKN
jgi:hypothetical protein